MSAREFVIAALASEPFRGLLTSIDALPHGRTLLNKLSRTRGVFRSFDEGWAVARRANPVGHENPSEIRIHLELSRSLRSSDYAVLYWLCRIAAQDGNLSLFDFGGNVGNLYYSYFKHLKETVLRITWTVFDLPAVIEEGRRIAAERGATNLRFTGSLQNASECNVLLASSAFHYWEEGVRAFLERFPKPPEHVIVHSTPVHDRAQDFITVQRTGACAFPCIVRNSTEMTTAFTSMDYNLVDRWQVLERCLRMPLFPGLTVPHYSGFYFRRRRNAAMPDTQWGAVAEGASARACHSPGLS